ncbi:MAG: hypothetical protein R3E32_20765 [Chitinophagales bacterium]
MKHLFSFLLLLSISQLLSSQNFDFIWTNTVGCNASGNTLTKTGSNGWNGGAGSENELAANTDGWIEMTVQENTKGKGFGLDISSSHTNYNTIDFAMFFTGSGVLRVYENGSLKSGSNLSSYNVGDVIRVQRSGTTISYQKNGNELFSTTGINANTILYGVASMNQVGATIGSAKASFNVPSTGPTCTDGIQNGDETGIDCGGSCPNACATCSDGIQNGDETGIDCGGSCPNACATCSDGIQNGDETGIDCGGSCPNACGGSGGSTVWTQSGNDIHYSDGKVWIGDVSLDVASTDYNLFVEKGIMTERLKVAIEGSGDWADYVFKNGYQLMSLEEVRTHIAQYGHLPNVPSAEQVANQGIDVSKMFPILLRQIEENKLYLIQMNEQIKALKEENTQLKKQISKKVK